jgi:hypothetical protein
MKWPWQKSSNHQAPFRADLPSVAFEPRLDFYSETWIALASKIEQRIQELREKNDSNIDPDRTALIRGQIRFAKEVLSWSAPQQAMVVDDDSEW